MYLCYELIIPPLETCKIRLFLHLRETEARFPIYWFVPQMPRKAEAGPCWRQEPGTQSKSPPSWLRPKHLSHHHHLPGCMSAGSWKWKQCQELNPGALTRDAGVSGRLLTAGPNGSSLLSIVSKRMKACAHLNICTGRFTARNWQQFKCS